MTCQVRVTSPDGHATKARALVDLASSASFITERLAQHLHLPRRHHEMKISGIGGTWTKSPRGLVDYKITNLGSKRKTLDMETLVLSKIKSILPLHPIVITWLRSSSEQGANYALTWSSTRSAKECRNPASLTIHQAIGVYMHWVILWMEIGDNTPPYIYPAK